MVISSITRLEKHVLKLEAREKLEFKDAVAVNGFIKRLECLNAGFMGYHCNVIDLISIQLVIFTSFSIHKERNCLT